MSDPVKSPDPLYDPIYGDAVVLITDLKAEIAALKAERDRLTIIADAIQAERDRAKEYAAAYFDEVAAIKAERDKLRAALEAIAYWGPVSTSGEPVMSMQEIARRALGGE